jgi:hypothetical protein
MHYALEMFEERFGRNATTVLIALIAVALATYSIKVFVEAIIEFQEIVASSQWFTWTHAHEFGASLLGWLIGLILFWIIVPATWNYYFKPRFARFNAQVQTALDNVEEKSKKRAADLREEIRQCYEQSQENYNRAELIMADAKAIVDKADAAMAEIERRECLLEIERHEDSTRENG